MRATYEVHAIRSGNWWALEVPSLRGVHSQVRRLQQAEAMARDAIALALEVPADSFDIVVVPTIGKDLDADAAAARSARAELARSREEADRTTRRFAQRAERVGVPVRDIAELLDVSFQYAAKIAKTGSEEARPRSARPAPGTAARSTTAASSRSVKSGTRGDQKRGYSSRV